jgi:23S rRNA (cytosine1962-C5)-methyltransferase
MTESPALTVSRKARRRLHPWVFSNEVRRVEGEPGPGDIVRVIEKGRFVGNAIYSPHSLIRARLFTQEDRDLDAALLVERIRAAWRLRQGWLDGEQDYRLVFGESDGLPGLTVDKYGNHFAVQVYAAGMERRLDLVTATLRDLFPVESVFAKNDISLRAHEGLERYERLLFGSLPESVTLSENGVLFHTDIRSGQKTGFYFDQRLNRARVRGLSAGRTVLDVFCYTGGFAVNAALGGADHVLAIDSSASACESVRANSRLNRVEQKVEVLCADAFEALRNLNQESRRFDIVIVDPPPFAKGQRDRLRAIKGYRDVNLQAMKLLNSGGFLLTCACSHHISWSDLTGFLAEASQACGRSFRVMDRLGQSPDHPLLLHMPESEYLRSYLLQLI